MVLGQCFQLNAFYSLVYPVDASCYFSHVSLVALFHRVASVLTSMQMQQTADRLLLGPICACSVQLLRSSCLCFTDFRLARR